MLRKLALAAALLASSPAWAVDTLTISVTSDVGVTGTATKTYTFTAGDMTVFQAYLLQQFPCSPAGQCTNTIPLAVTAWMQSLRDGTVANVVNWQKGSASQSAVTAVVPITPN